MKHELVQIVRIGAAAALLTAAVTAQASTSASATRCRALPACPRTGA